MTTTIRLTAAQALVRWPSVQRTHIPTGQIFHEAGREFGFDGIENGHRWLEDPAEPRTLLKEYGLTFISGWHSTELLDRSVEEEIDAYMAATAPSTTLLPKRLARDTGLDDSEDRR